MDEARRQEITEKLETMAVPMEKAEFTREEYNKLFPEGKIRTPVETVKLGAHQFERLKERKREKLLGAMKQTLEDPIVILNENRGGKPARVYIKSFLNNKLDEHTNVLTIVVDIEGEPVAVSTGERRMRQINEKIKTASIPLYIKGGGSPTHGTGGSPEGKPPVARNHAHRGGVC